MFISRGEYIANIIKGQREQCAIDAAAYVKYAVESGARISDDGYPDTRFKGTYGAEFTKIRLYIARLRKKYDHQYPHANYVRNYERKYGVSL